MTLCCIPGCKNRTFGRKDVQHPKNAQVQSCDPASRSHRITFHKVPVSKDVTEQWNSAVNDPSFLLLESSFVCSVHFPSECFIFKAKRKYLKPDSVPKFFPHLMNTVYTDHNYQLPSQAQLKRKLDIATNRIEVLKKKLKLDQQRKQRLQKKCASLKDIVLELEKKNLIDDKSANLLKSTKSKVPLHLFKKLTGKSGPDQKCSEPYSDELKTFAVTLNFYSPKGYNYVRKTFDLQLPHEGTIRRWFTAIDGSPGFNQHSLDLLEKKVKEQKSQNKEVIVSVVFDEMSIKKKVEWDGEKFIGLENFGSGIDTQQNCVPATEALAFMAVDVNNSSKSPLGYFFISHVNAEEKSKLVEMCIKKLSDIGVVTSNITCDSPATNLATIRRLGASLDPDDLRCTFPHPSDPNQKVAVILDPCHMLKLARNTLSDLGIMKDNEGNEIKWDYISQLEKIQNSEELHLANRLKRSHINWHSQKMKVNIAAQTLSRSVADAIDYCRVELKLAQFKGSEATTKFIRKVDRIFDIMNSRNVFGKGYKSPMKLSNKKFWSAAFEDTFSYFQNLKTLNGVRLVDTPRKNPFLGFMVNIKSFEHLFETLVESGRMKYILTYKMSQDHIELFFCAIRSKFGANNNPTVTEFERAFKRLLVHNDIVGNRGNCFSQDETSLLTSNFLKKQKRENKLTEDTDYNLETFFRLSLEEEDHTYSILSCTPSLNEYQSAVVEYIGGFCVRMGTKMLKCFECKKALNEEDHSKVKPLVALKDRGGLIHCNESVRVVCETTEKNLKEVLMKSPGIVPTQKQLGTKLTNIVLKQVSQRYD